MPQPTHRDFRGGAIDGRVSGGLGIGDATITLKASPGSTGWPDGPSECVIDPGGANEEQVIFTSRVGLVLSGVSRGQNNSVAKSHNDNEIIRHIGTKRDFQEANDHASDTEADPHATKLLNTTRHDVTARHAIGTALAVAAPGNSAPGDVASAGVANSLARSDHLHGRESAAGVPFAPPGSSAPGDTIAEGASASASRADHRHGREAASSPGSTVNVQAATVATQQSTTSGFGDLGTVGPSVTITVGSSGVLVVSIYSWISNNIANGTSLMGFALSGANSRSPSNAEAIQSTNSSVSEAGYRIGATIVLTGLTPGSTTVTAKYSNATGGNTASFADRRISAWTYS